MAVVVGALIISLLFNLHYYATLRVENENLLHTIRARALWTYGDEAGRVADLLEEWLETQNFDIYEEALSAIYRTGVQAGILTQGLSEESAPMYYELKSTAWTLHHYFWFALGPGAINLTKVGIFAQALDSIGSTISLGSFDVIKNKDPLEVLSQSDINKIVNCCQQIQEMVPY